jgi:putative flavoprotein involved in K+ transport
MQTATTIVLGAGHAGLAMSRCLAARGIDHVVLERGEVANSWRTERWDSLRLLTPNWQTRLPGIVDDGGHPDGFRTVPEVVELIARYARSIAAPVRTHTRVTAVHRTDTGYLVRTDRGDWHGRAVVVATGACNMPRIPALAADLPPSIRTLTPMEYRNPAQLGPGGVLVVGASATGVQLAEEIRRSGRAVTLAVGEHIRAPRTYRGRDIQWWMDAAGLLDQSYRDVDDLARARKVPSLQLVGSPERRTLDLNVLTALGVELVGRLVGVGDGRLRFSGSLRNQCALSDLKAARLLATIDRWATNHGLDSALAAPHSLEPTQVEGSPRLDLSIGRGGVATVIWATGFRPDYRWLNVPDVLDGKGRLRHDGGIVGASNGLYALGLPFLRRRKSALIDGAGADATELADHLVTHLRDSATRWRIAAA